MWVREFRLDTGGVGCTNCAGGSLFYNINKLETQSWAQIGLILRCAREEERPCIVVRECRWVGKPPICPTPSPGQRQVTACMLAYTCLQMQWWAAVTVVDISSQKALLMCPYVSPGKFSVLAPSCSRALLHLQLTSDRCLILASLPTCSLHLIDVWFLQAIWLLEWSLQLPSFLALYVSKGRAGPSNTSLRTLCFHFAVTWSLPSTCHMQGDWYCLALP